MDKNKSFEKRENKNEVRTRGRNFNEPPLTFEEFFNKNKTDYNNFLHNFWDGKNYERLKKINEELANKLREIAINYFTLIKQNKKPKEDWKELGYQAYLILRENYKNDETLLKKINEYYGGELREKNNLNEKDDWPAFFS